MFVPIIFIALYWGTPYIVQVLGALEGTVAIHMLEVIGGGLAAIGIATTIYVIGRDDYLLFFLLAYFLSVIFADLNVTMVTYAILGTLIAGIFVLAKGNNGKGDGTGSAPEPDGGFVEEYDDGF